ncbi:hypothetical protein GIB67_042355 [Kingdonia uniflora]|uniref:Uncharacterized protein n=1 Tax=Kingdonia uniflora TaxID=39325 RepID=A0A7J7N266_9MAGN|nr:hypothetical protein GIB67_042355 [Kingdonia uniflora]
MMELGAQGRDVEATEMHGELQVFDFSTMEKEGFCPNGYFALIGLRFVAILSFAFRVAVLVDLPSLQEAYEEFKHVLLALIYGKDDQTSPVANEVDIQALVHAMESTRQGVVDSLEFSKGNLFQAFQVHFQLFVDVLLLPLVKSTFQLFLSFSPFDVCLSQNEISRTKLNDELPDELVHENYVYRGLIEGSITSSFSGILPGLGYVSSKVSNNDFIDDSSKEKNAEAMVIDSTELRFINEVTSNHEDYGTS